MITYKVNDWIKRYYNGELDEKFRDNKYFGWYDWFCSSKSLKNRTKKLIPKVKFLVDYGIIDGDKFSIWMKNNCPIQGNTFDDIRLDRISDDEFVGGFSPSMGYDGNKKGWCRVWFLGENDASYEFKNWMDFKNKVKSGDFTQKYK